MNNKSEHWSIEAQQNTADDPHPVKAHGGFESLS